MRVPAETPLQSQDPVCADDQAPHGIEPTLEGLGFVTTAVMAGEIEAHSSSTPRFWKWRRWRWSASFGIHYLLEGSRSSRSPETGWIPAFLQRPEWACQVA